MGRLRIVRLTQMTFALAVLSACAGVHQVPTGAAASSVATRQPLKCQWPNGKSPDSGSRAIGPSGGSITLRQSKLDVPRGALNTTVTFTMRELSGDSVGVQITPAATFTEAAEVRIDVGSSRCRPGVDRDDYYAYRYPDGGGSPQRLPTWSPWWNHKIYGELTQNSWIIIAD